MVLLILHRKVERSETLLKQFRMKDTAFAAAEDMPTPADIHIRQILFRLPVLRIKHRIDTCTIGPGRISENAESSISPCLISIDPGIHHGSGIFFHMLPDEVILFRFIQRSHKHDRLIHQFGKLRKGITEKSGNPSRYIDARPFEFRKRDHLKPCHTKASLLPNGTDAQKIEEFSDILPRGAHIRSGPQYHTDIFRIFTLVSDEFFYHAIAQLHTELPSCGGGHGTGICTIEIAPRWKERNATGIR